MKFFVWVMRLVLLLALVGGLFWAAGRLPLGGRTPVGWLDHVFDASYFRPGYEKVWRYVTELPERSRKEVERGREAVERGTERLDDATDAERERLRKVIEDKLRK